MKQYSVQQLASLAQISVRTLHYYDHIGLLKPHTRTGAGYRLYSEKELLRLQQFADDGMADFVPEFVQFKGQATQALACPSQRRLRITASDRFDQSLQRREQAGIGFRQRSTPTARPAEIRKRRM